MPGTTAGHTDAVGQQIPNLLGDQLDAQRHQLPLRPHALAFCSNQDASLRGTGGAIFAGTLLIISAGLWMLQGLAGIVEGTSYIESPNCWITTSGSTWGWIHLVGGIISLAAGFGVFSGAAWPRWLGILNATISVFVDVTFIPFEPW
jgi:hypothetical protein